MKRLLLLLLSVSLALGFGGLANAGDIVKYEFNPADFFAFKHWSEGPSTDGGMFRLHKNPPPPLANTIYSSWDGLTGWPLLDAMRSSLDDLDSDGTSYRAEGIGAAQAMILTSPDPSGNLAAWGQTLTADPNLAPTATAPSGWQAFVGGTAGAWYISWEADSAAEIIRPGEPDSLSTFSFTFTANETITYGNNYTFWFSQANWPGYLPAIDFGSFPGGFEAQKPGDLDTWVGTQYEATRSLEALVPEPATLTNLACLGLIAGMVGWRRWLHRSCFPEGRKIH